MGHNNTQLTTIAQIFMVRSLLESYQDIVHIMPTSCINANELFAFIQKVMKGSENIGFQVVCIITDNIPLKKKAVSLFS